MVDQGEKSHFINDQGLKAVVENRKLCKCQYTSSNTAGGVKTYRLKP